MQNLALVYLVLLVGLLITAPLVLSAVFARIAGPRRPSRAASSPPIKEEESRRFSSTSDWKRSDS